MTTTEAPAPPGFKRGDSWNSEDARRAYEEAGHDFDAIQKGESPTTFADGTVAAGAAAHAAVKPEPEKKKKKKK